MDNLGKEIIEAWNNEQRVKALKIVIQVNRFNEIFYLSVYLYKAVIFFFSVRKF